MKLMVLMSCFNGERYLREQLDSCFSQTLDGVELLVRDDGSSDRTPEILEAYSKPGRLSWAAGEHLGAARSFWSLVREVGEADFYAFCDQDDVWDNDKLETAVRALKAIPAAAPALYCSDVRVTDAELHVVHPSMVKDQPTDFPHACIKNLAPGCTYVWNRAAQALLRRYDAGKLGIWLHDWTAYQIAACFGQIVFDRDPHMSYRQHGGNTIGAASGSLAEYYEKIPEFWSGEKRGSRSRQALRLEQAYGDIMPAKNREWIRLLAHYDADPDNKRTLIRRSAELHRAYRLPFRLLLRFNKL